MNECRRISGYPRSPCYAISLRFALVSSELRARLNGFADGYALVTVPESINPGSSVPVTITVGGGISQASITIAVR